METIKLNIIRKKSYLGAIVPYIVFFNDIEIAKIPNGRQVSLDVPADKKFTLTISVLNNNSIVKKMNPHSQLFSKKVMIHPEYCKNGVVNCIITTEANLIGTISLGWLRSMSELGVSIDYK